MRSDQVAQGNTPGVFILLGIEKQTEFRGTFEPGIIFAGEIGQLAKMRDHGGLKLLLEQGQEFLTNARTGTFGIAIRGVFAPGLAAGVEIGAENSAADFEERAENRAGFGVNAAESGEAGAAEHVSKNSLGLIVRSVSYGDFVEMAFRNEAFKASIAGTAGYIFKIGALAFGFRGDVFTGNEKWQIMTCGEFGDEHFVGLRCFAAELVIEMDNGENNPQLFAEFKEEQKKGYGIGATGNGYANASSGTQQAMALKRGQKWSGRIRGGGPARLARWNFSGHDEMCLS